MPRLGSCRTISTNGSEVTTRNGRIKAAGVSASRRCKHSLTPSPLRGKKRSLPDHHQQRTGHLQKGTVCKIKYKLLQIISTVAASSAASLINPIFASHAGEKIAGLNLPTKTTETTCRSRSCISALAPQFLDTALDGYAAKMSTYGNPAGERTVPETTTANAV